MADRQLRRLTVSPVLLTAVIYTVALALGIFTADDVLARFWAQPAEGWLVFVWWTAAVLVGAILVLLLVLTFLAVTMVIAGPFYERMAELILDQHRVPRTQTSFVRSAARELAWSITFAIPAVIFGVLALIPGVGIAFAVLSLLVAGFGLATTAVGPALSATGKTYGDRLRFTGSSLPLLAGVAVVMSAGVFVPILGLIMIPSAVVGTTGLLARSGRLGPSRTAAEHSAPAAPLPERHFEP